MPLIPQSLKDTIGWSSSPNTRNQSSMLDNKVTKKTIVAIGTMQAGKTTHFAGLGATAQYKASDSAKTDHKFRFIPREGHTNLLDDIAELRCGYFPPATPIVNNSIVKPAFSFEWEEPTLLGSFLKVKRQADMPVIDYAGEQLVQLMSKVRAAKTLEQAMAIDGTDQLTVTVNQASALLLIIKADRAEGIKEIYKPEPWDKIKGMSKHPDVNLQRIVGPIIEYKHDNRQYTPPLERIGIVVTACDVLFPIAKVISAFTHSVFDPLNPEISNESLDSFMKAFFPGTHSLISSLNLNIQYFPSYFETDGFWDPPPVGDPVPGAKYNTVPRIKRGNIFDSPDWVHNVMRPKYTEYWFNREIEWLKEFATMV